MSIKAFYCYHVENNVTFKEDNFPRLYLNKNFDIYLIIILFVWRWRSCTQAGCILKYTLLLNFAQYNFTKSIWSQHFGYVVGILKVVTVKFIVIMYSKLTSWQINIEACYSNYNNSSILDIIRVRNFDPIKAIYSRLLQYWIAFFNTIYDIKMILLMLIFFLIMY